MESILASDLARISVEFPNLVNTRRAPFMAFFPAVPADYNIGNRIKRHVVHYAPRHKSRWNAHVGRLRGRYVTCC